MIVSPNLRNGIPQESRFSTADEAQFAAATFMARRLREHDG